LRIALNGSILNASKTTNTMQMSINTETFLTEAAPAAWAACGHMLVGAPSRSADAEALAGRHAR
jgi:hypothetical protein